MNGDQFFFGGGKNWPPPIVAGGELKMLRIIRMFWKFGSIPPALNCGNVGLVTGAITLGRFIVDARNPDMLFVLIPGVGVPLVNAPKLIWANAGFARSNSTTTASPLVNLRTVHLPGLRKSSVLA